MRRADRLFQIVQVLRRRRLTWLLAGWCELREGFRTFRLDRMRDLEVLESVAPEPGRTLQDFLVAVGA